MKIVAIGCSHTMGHELVEIAFGDQLQENYERAFGKKYEFNSDGTVKNPDHSAVKKWDAYCEDYFGIEQYNKISNRFSWAGQVGEELNIEVLNLGKRGYSNTAAYSELIMQDIDEDDIILWGLTGINRETQFNPWETKGIVNFAYIGMEKRAAKQIENFLYYNSMQGSDIISKLVSLHGMITAVKQKYKNVVVVDTADQLSNIKHIIEEYDIGEQFYDVDIDKSSQSKLVQTLQLEFDQMIDCEGLKSYANELNPKKRFTLHGHFSQEVHSGLAVIKVIPIIKGFLNE